MKIILLTIVMSLDGHPTSHTEKIPVGMVTPQEAITLCLTQSGEIVESLYETGATSSSKKFVIESVKCELERR